MNEPHMAPWWFPANDHPLDKARFDVHVTVPRGTDVVVQRAAPRLSGAWRPGPPTTGARPTRWRPTSRSSPPVTTPSSAAARTGCPWVNAVSRSLAGHRSRSHCGGCARPRRITSWLEDELGDYPFDSTGGLVTGLNPGFALENQTRPTYPFVGGSATYLLVHELAHQWFGDSVSVRGWRDIWLNEGFASYIEARWDGDPRRPERRRVAAPRPRPVRRRRGVLEAARSPTRGPQPDLRRGGLRPRRDDARRAPQRDRRRDVRHAAAGPGWSSAGTATPPPRTSWRWPSRSAAATSTRSSTPGSSAPEKPADTAANGLG